LAWCTAVSALSLATAAAAEPAADQATGPEPEQGSAGAAEQPERDFEPAETPLPWRVWPLFDPFVSRREALSSFGLDELREIDERRPRNGWTIGIGDTMTTTRPYLWVNLERQLIFRSTQRSTYMLDLSRYGYTAGVRLLGLEVGAGVGLSPLAVDVSKGKWSVSAISPMALAKAGLKIGKVRLSVDAFSQYLWRWYGRANARIEGIAFQIAFEQKRELKRNRHPLILIY
jgi:hypothetical protein